MQRQKLPPALDLGRLLREDPAAADSFYCGEELAELADCVVVVKGIKLRAHSQILSSESTVFRDMVRTLPTPTRDDPLVVAALFDNATLPQAVGLLRAIYDTTVALENLFPEAWSDEALGALQLAHVLNIERLMTAATARATRCSPPCSPKSSAWQGLWVRAAAAAAARRCPPSWRRPLPPRQVKPSPSGLPTS